MRLIYEHDQEEDFVEIHLTEKELKDILKGDPVAKDFPAALHERRNTNIYIRRGANAVS